MNEEDKIELYRSIESETRESSIKWLRRIQHELAPKDLYTFAKAGGNSSPPIEDPIAWTDDHFDRLYIKPLLEALRSADLLCVAHIPVGIIYTHNSDPNAYAIGPIDLKCSPVIVVDWTVYLLIDAVVPIALDYILTPRGKREPIRQRVRDCIQDVISNGKLARIPRIEHDDAVMVISHVIETCIYAFIIAHEYGHIILGDFDQRW